MGVWVMFISFATSKKGGKLGGFLIGVPSTAGLAFFFTGWFVSPQAAVGETTDFPLFISLSGIFLLCFAFLARRGFASGLILSLLVWFASSLLVYGTGVDDLTLSLLGSLTISAIVYCIFRFGAKPRKSNGGGNPNNSPWVATMRFLLGGGIVTIAVLFAQVGIPILSAMAASFPALSTSALVAVRMNSKTEGTEIARGLTMSATVSIMVILIPFSVAVHYFFPMVGVFYGTLCSYGVAALIGIPYYYSIESHAVPNFGSSAIAQDGKNQSLRRGPSAG